MDWLKKPIELLGFKPDLEAQIFPFVSQIAAALLAAVLAWFLIHHGQRRAAEEGRRIERARILHDLDREYAALMARRCVLKRRNRSAASATTGKARTEVCAEIVVDEAKLANFELVLTERVKWRSQPARADEGAGPNQYRMVNGRRFVDVADGYLVDTLTLHEVIAWAKRVASGVQAQVIDPRDVADMWRNVLPWARESRFTFMAAMFGTSRRISDMQVSGWYSLPRRLAYDAGRVAARASAQVSSFLPWRDRFDREIPKEWSGDIAPLYFLIQIVVREAFASRRPEIIHYLRLHNGPAEVTLATLDHRSADAPGGLDRTIHRVLFQGGPAVSDDAAPLDANEMVPAAGFEPAAP